jgi:hypothetical protein
MKKLRFGEDARTDDFLGGGGTGALQYAPKAPDVSLEELTKAAANRAVFDAAANKAKAIQLNNAYQIDRGAADSDTLRRSNLDASASWNHVGIDWGLLPAAAEIIVPLIATAATGGLAAPSVYASYNKLKNISSIKDAVSAVNEAQHDVASVKATFKVPDLRDPADLSAVHAIADQIIGDKNVKTAQQIISNTLALASTGDVDAQRGALILSQVAGVRTQTGVGIGQSLSVPTVPQSALIASLSPQILKPLTPIEVQKIATVNPLHWWEKLLALIGLERKAS